MALQYTTSNGETLIVPRSEEHTSELQSPCNLVCRLLLEKKFKNLHSHYRLHKSECFLYFEFAPEWQPQGSRSAVFSKQKPRPAQLRRERFSFFFNDTATTEIYNLSLHDALPICGADISQEEEDDDGREEAALDEVVLDAIDGSLDKNGLIADHLRLDIGRQGSGNLLQPPFDFVGGGDRVHAALFGHDQGYRRDAIQAGGGTRLLVAVLRLADVRHRHDVAVARGHGDLVELRRIQNAARGADGKFAGAAVQFAARQLQILRAQGVEHVVDGQVVGTQAVGIHLDMDLAARAAHDGTLADARGVFQLLFDLLIGDQGDVAQGTPGGDGDLQNGRRVGVELLHHGLLGGLRQLRHNQ